MDLAAQLQQLLEALPLDPANKRVEILTESQVTRPVVRPRSRP